MADQNKMNKEEAGRIGGERSQGGGSEVGSSQQEHSKSGAGRKGGSQSGGNFKNDPERAGEAGRKGGQR